MQTKSFSTPEISRRLSKSDPYAIGNIHFYKNLKTNEIYYGMDYKVKLENSGRVEVNGYMKEYEMHVAEYLNKIPKNWRPES